MSITVLVLYNSQGPLIESLATAVAEGVSNVEGAQPLTKRVPKATRQDIIDSDAVIVGSPN